MHSSLFHSPPLSFTPSHLSVSLPPSFPPSPFFFRSARESINTRRDTYFASVHIFLDSPGVSSSYRSSLTLTLFFSFRFFLCTTFSSLFFHNGSFHTWPGANDLTLQQRVSHQQHDDTFFLLRRLFVLVLTCYHFHILSFDIYYSTYWH